MDISKVIYLGHSAKQPLIWPSTELSDGFEPHGHITHRVVPGKRVPVAAVGGRGVPGVGWLGGYLGGAIPGTQPRPD